MTYSVGMRINVVSVGSKRGNGTVLTVQVLLDILLYCVQMYPNSTMRHGT